jgi:hypothetical protein
MGMTRGHLFRGNSSTGQEKGFVMEDTPSLRQLADFKMGQERRAA